MAIPKKTNGISASAQYAWDESAKTWVAVSSAAGGGTQYTEDAAAAANPVGNAVNLVRQDTPATITTTDGDNVSQRGTNYGAAYTQIVTSSGSFVDTFGGGTQYTEGDADATITGTAAMMEVAANVLQPVQGTVADGLLVNLGANNDVTVTGSVAVTNAALSVVGGGVEATALRVTVASDSTGVLSIDDNGGSITVDGTVAVTHSSLAVVGGGVESTAMRVTLASDSTGLVSVDDNGGSITVDNAALSVVGSGTEAAAMRVTIATDSTGVLSIDDNGGSVTVDGTITEANSAAIAASLSVIDDWDETDRAKVNPIVGQAGVTGGSGVVGAAVQRVVLATDVALPTGTNVIGGITHNASAAVTGLSVSKTDAQTATVTAVKASAGRVHGYHIFNSNTADAFLHFYDIASGSVTVGTSTRLRTLWIPAGGAIDSLFVVPLTFGTAISIAATTTITGSTTPTTGLLVDVDYV